MGIDYTASEYLDEGSDSIIFKHLDFPVVLRFKKDEHDGSDSHRPGVAPKLKNWLTCDSILNFHECVIKNIIPSRYLLEKFELAQISGGLIDHVVKNSSKRGSNRRSCCRLIGGNFLILTDISRMGDGLGFWSVEIKPKWGFIEPFRTADGDIVGFDQCKFCMQNLSRIKSNIYEINNNNKYCPLDLFSNCRTRIERAIENLIKFPQNNLKLFYQGRRIKISEINDTNLNFIQSSLIEIIFNDADVMKINTYANKSSMRCKTNPALNCCLDDTCTKRACGGIFDIVLRYQMQDLLGLDKVCDLWNSLGQDPRQQLNDLVSNYNSELWKNLNLNPSSLYEMQNSVYHIRNFLLSMTFRDCSVVFTFKHHNHLPQNLTDFTYLKFGDNELQYSIKLLDLDPKSPTNIQFYHENTQYMLNMYKTNTCKNSDLT